MTDSTTSPLHRSWSHGAYPIRSHSLQPHTPSHTSITHCSSFMVLLHAHHTPSSQPNTDNIWKSEVGSNTPNLRSQETGIFEAGGRFTSSHPSFEDAARLPMPTATLYPHPHTSPTPPLTSLCVDASLGKPSLRVPMSVVVPPTSTTSAFFSPDSHIAPRILFVGPEEKVRMGNSTERLELQG